MVEFAHGARGAVGSGTALRAAASGASLGAGPAVCRKDAFGVLAALSRSADGASGTAPCRTAGTARAVGGTVVHACRAGRDRARREGVAELDEEWPRREVGAAGGISSATALAAVAPTSALTALTAAPPVASTPAGAARTERAHGASTMPASAPLAPHSALAPGSPGAAPLAGASTHSAGAERGAGQAEFGLVVEPCPVGAAALATGTGTAAVTARASTPTGPAAPAAAAVAVDSVGAACPASYAAPAAMTAARGAAARPSAAPGAALAPVSSPGLAVGQLGAPVDVQRTGIVDGSSQRVATRASGSP